MSKRATAKELELGDTVEICWNTMNDAGYIKYSKTHLLDLYTDRLLCGVKVPYTAEYDDFNEFGSDGTCKRCLSINKKGNF